MSNDERTETGQDIAAQGVAGQPVAVLDRSRALVFVERRVKRRSVARASADFVAQLIASEARLGEYRRARREDPLVGSQRYRQVDARPAPGFQVQV